MRKEAGPNFVHEKTPKHSNVETKCSWRLGSHGSLTDHERKVKEKPVYRPLRSKKRKGSGTSQRKKRKSQTIIENQSGFGKKNTMYDNVD